MSRSFRWISGVALAGIMLGCGGDKAAAGSSNAASDGTVLTPYLAIGEVLASDSLDKLSELGARVVKASEAKQGQPGIDKVVQGAARVGAQDIATARSAFKKMSEGVIEYMKANPDKQGGHMIVHCPMTFGGKGGLWVQKDGKVSNPYEGRMMPSCGSKLEWSADLPKT